MIDIKNIQSVYFIGIGGIGMSALARYFSFHGKKVTGYDKTPTQLTRQLENEGIEVHYEDNPDLALKSADIIVYTPAVPKDHRELNYFRDNGYTILKRSDVLGIITNGSFNICVAGTHGKTTISTMIAHILRDSGYGCNAFLGGISSNYNSNYWSNERNVCVVEADEYDRSFLKLHPDIAVISAMDADHLDIYGDEQTMQEAFVDFSGKVKNDGLLLHKLGLTKAGSFRAPKQMTYDLQNTGADAFATDITMNDGSYRFNVQAGDWKLSQVELNMGGQHNIENMITAITVAHIAGVEDEEIRSAVRSFRGVKRRFEYIVKKSEAESESGIVYIDDYAHHPEELKALINGAKSLFSGMHSTVIFQPHLFTRTRDFADEFAATLDMADEIILLPVYPARELPIEGVNSEMILDKMNNPNKRLLAKNEVVDYLEKSYRKTTNRQLIITAGAGDIDTLVPAIQHLLTA